MFCYRFDCIGESLAIIPGIPSSILASCVLEPPARYLSLVYSLLLLEEKQILRCIDLLSPRAIRNRNANESSD